jgi:hypothetical protein
MIELVTSVSIATVLSVGAAAPRPAVPTLLGPLAAAASIAFPAPSSAVAASARRAQMPAKKDSLRNGAITGAIAGGISGALLGSIGCGVANALDQGWGGPETSSNCAGPTILVAALGAGLGAAIGAGVDAMFEQAPSAGAGPGGKRKGVRLRWRF